MEGARGKLIADESLSFIEFQFMIKKVDAHTVSKKEFVEKLCERVNEDRQIVERIFLESLDLIVDELQDGHKLEFRGAFVLGTKHNKARQAMNPKKREKVLIPEKRSVYFKPGDGLKKLD